MSDTRLRTLRVSEECRPALPRHVKLRFDETRQIWVILAPERVLAPDEIAVEVLQLCDGARSVENHGADDRVAPRTAELCGGKGDRPPHRLVLDSCGHCASCPPVDPGLPFLSLSIDGFGSA